MSEVGQSIGEGEGAEAPKVHFGFAKSSWVRAGREGGWVLGGQISVAVAGLVGMRVLTELAPKEVLGEVTLLVGALGLIKGLLVAPLVNAQIRYYPEYEAMGRGAWFEKATGRWVWSATGLTVAGGTLGYLAWRGIAGEGWKVSLLAVLIAYFLVDLCKSVHLAYLSAERRQARASMWGGLDAWLWMLGAAVALKITCSAESYVTGQVVGSAVVLAVLGWWLGVRRRDTATGEEPSRETLRHKVWSFSLPLVPLALVGWVTNQADRYILGGMHGLADTGRYTAAYSLASRPMLLLGGVTYSVARPILFQAQSVGNTAKANKVFKLWLAGAVTCAVLGVAGFASLGWLMARLFEAQAYREQAPTIMAWVALGYGLSSIAVVLEGRLLSFGVSRSTVMPAVAGAVANTILNLILIPKYDAVGAAMATAGAFALQLAWTWWALWGYVRGNQKQNANDE